MKLCKGYFPGNFSITMTSDWHLGKDSFNLSHEERIKKLQKNAWADILFFLGDLIEPLPNEPSKNRQRLLEVLKLLEDLPFARVVVLPGNNDLECFGRVTKLEALHEFSSLCRKFRLINLQDENHFSFRGVSFVGSIGWSDGSLWEPFTGEVTTFPNSPIEVKTRYDLLHRQSFKEKEYAKYGSFLSTDCFCSGFKKAQNSDIVLLSHFVPTKDFVNSSTEEFNYRNWRMGSSALAEHYRNSRVLGGFVGHTHRNEEHQVFDKTVYNVSGREQPTIFTFV